MKNALRLFVFVIAIIVAANSHAETPKAVDSDDGPFYVMDYDELKKITKEQKSFYMGQLVVHIPKAFKEFPKDKILAASKDEERWGEIEKRVNILCYSQMSDAVCKPLQEARVKAFKMGATH